MVRAVASNVNSSKLFKILESQFLPTQKGPNIIFLIELWKLI